MNKALLFSFLLSFTAAYSSEQFSLLTSNVLSHAFYTAYSNKHVINSADRIEAFSEYMRKAKMDNIDILCFQEWPYGTTPVQKQELITVISHDALKPSENNYYNNEYGSFPKNGYILGTEKIFNEKITENLQHIFPTSHYHYLKDPYKQEKDGILMVVNKEKFDVLGTQWRTLRWDDKEFAHGKIVYAALLAFKKNPNKTLAVLTTHVPFNDYMNKNLETLKKVIDSYDVNAKIVCGDFNYDSWDAKNNFLNKESVQVIKNIFNGFKASCDDLPYATARSGSNNNPLLLDYVFYSPNLTKIETDIIPAQLKENSIESLIAHTNENKPTKQMFYSDHGAVRYSFAL